MTTFLSNRDIYTSVDCGIMPHIAFKVAFEEHSRMIIGENGADRLNCKGDFLFRDSTGLHRGQAQYISDEGFESLCARIDTENQIC